MIRGIREIRGYDQPVGGSPGVTCSAFREEIFCRASSGRSSPYSFGVTALSERLKADTYASLTGKRAIAVVPNVLECGLYRRTPSHRATRGKANHGSRRFKHGCNQTTLQHGQGA